jgi:hypothetical protein
MELMDKHGGFSGVSSRVSRLRRERSLTSLSLSGFFDENSSSGCVDSLKVLNLDSSETLVRLT